ncbi:MAG: uracil-DNA glycosylase [Pseudomonadota bacterium]
MTRPSANDLSFDAALAALAWQVELGVDEAISDSPIDRFVAEAGPSLKGLKFTKESNIQPLQANKPVVQAAPEVAALMAGQAKTLDDLRNAMGIFDQCSLKEGARNLVFADGTPGAKVMIIGEAPGRDEDREGRPFVGRAGQLLDKMFAAIDLGRERSGQQALYITNVVPWRPPQNRDPNAEEIAMMRPFLARHVELAAPEVLVVMGNTALNAVLGKTGITRVRGTWAEAFGLPVMPMFHPAALLRDPLKKRPAWEDLQNIQDRLA